MLPSFSSSSADCREGAGTVAITEFIEGIEPGRLGSGDPIEYSEDTGGCIPAAVLASGPTFCCMADDGSARRDDTAAESELIAQSVCSQRRQVCL